jgi:hypothetical protein
MDLHNDAVGVRLAAILIGQGFKGEDLEAKIAAYLLTAMVKGNDAKGASLLDP